ncbi:MAG: hypothetical protein HY862_05050 [Chloroflexi bacterium]|nr:hypothetical protein [Chloroflexota bacterium]
MESVLLTLSVIVLFLVRVGIPVVLLIALGMVIDRWQKHRNVNVQRNMTEHHKPVH